MNGIPRGRRFLCASVSLALAAVLFHRQLADALVTRGDDAYRSGDVAAAMRSYERALHVDARSSIAADRLAFVLALRHEPISARRAIDVATAGLASNEVVGLLADRGLAELQLRRWTQAENDFARAGLLAGDARYDHLAARMAIRAGDRGAARSFALRAIHDDPRFAPARALVRSFE